MLRLALKTVQNTNEEEEELTESRRSLTCPSADPVPAAASPIPQSADPEREN